MFGKKLVVIAAAVAVAMGHVAAHEQATTHHIKVTVVKQPVTAKKTHHVITKKHHTKQVNETAASYDGEFDPSEYCMEGWSPMSVEGVEGVFCVNGQACVDDIDGACPDPQQGLPYGGYCDTVETGVMGCKPVTEEMWWETNGEDDEGHTDGSVCGAAYSPMSVEGVEGVFCVDGQACVADIMGSCPGPQDDLEFGAYCGTVKTGVLGCKPYTEAQTPAGGDDEEMEEDSSDDATCDDGYSPMSVEGVEGVFCVDGQSCVADIMGSCPDAQDGLEYGSYCGTVKTGVLGCKPYADDSQTPEEEEGDIVIEVCDDGYSPMSVEGVEGIYCVDGQACAGVEGTCPEAQDGLEYGSYCGKVASGVLGCKPYTDDSHTMETTEADEGGDDDDDVEVVIDVCDDGSSPMSVEGVEGVFCVTGQACAGVDGACPGPQDGLEFGAHCGKVASGVLGCVPNTSHHHKKHHVKSHSAHTAKMNTRAHQKKPHTVVKKVKVHHK